MAGCKKGQTHGTKNLIPANQLTPEERHELASKGGKACAQKKRFYKNLSDWTKYLGEEVVKNQSGDEMQRYGVVMLQQFKLAMQGDTRAARFIAELSGDTVYDRNANKAQALDTNITLKIE